MRVSYFVVSFQLRTRAPLRHSPPIIFFSLVWHLQQCTQHYSHQHTHIIAQSSDGQKVEPKYKKKKIFAIECCVLCGVCVRNIMKVCTTDQSDQQVVSSPFHCRTQQKYRRKKIVRRHRIFHCIGARTSTSMHNASTMQCMRFGYCTWCGTCASANIHNFFFVFCMSLLLFVSFSASSLSPCTSTEYTHKRIAPTALFFILANVISIFLLLPLQRVTRLALRYVLYNTCVPLLVIIFRLFRCWCDTNAWCMYGICVNVRRVCVYIMLSLRRIASYMHFVSLAAVACACIQVVLKVVDEACTVLAIHTHSLSDQKKITKTKKEPNRPRPFVWHALQWTRARG